MPDRTKVCLLTGEYPPLQGGVGDYTARLAAALAARGADVHVLTGARSAEEQPPPGVTLHATVPAFNRSLPATVSAALRDLRPDILHIQYQAGAYGLHPAINALPWLLRRRDPALRLVVTLHDLLFPYLFPKAGPLRFRAVLAMLRSCHAAIVTNAEDRDALLRHGRLPPVHLIPIGSNISAQPPAGYDRAAWRAALGIAPADTLLCYFGFLSPAKGAETLIRALGLLAGAGAYHLLMVGSAASDSDPTSQSYLLQVQGLIRQLGLEDRVHWTGFAATDHVSAHLLAADMAVLPYRQGANLRHGSLHAALAHGLPIITTRPPDGSSGALADGEEAVLGPPDDPPAMAAAIAALAADQPRRARLSAGALALAGQFSWESIAAAHLEVYRRLAPDAA